MRIDERVEAHVRQAFSAVIARDGERMVEAMRGLDEADSQRAVGLALYVCGFVVNDIHRSGATDSEIHELAAQITRSESRWVNLNTAQVATLLRAAAAGDDTFGGLSHADVPGLAFVAGGHLLGAFSYDDQAWHEYLDQIWAVLEAAPDLVVETP